jgi:hypothetical protein
MKVKFMYHQEERDLYAYFPESVYSGIFGTTFECFSEGMHSVCDKRYIEDSREVDAEKYKPLLNELRKIYNDIQII